MASMGSLGHYMQEAAGYGFRIKDFYTKVTGTSGWRLWRRGPRTYAEWVLIDEKAEGGDMLAVQAREHPHFSRRYSRICEGAGLRSTAGLMAPAGGRKALSCLSALVYLCPLVKPYQLRLANGRARHGLVEVRLSS
jgi:hypothetical protein